MLRNPLKNWADATLVVYNRLLKCIDEAKRQYEAGGNDDNNLYGLIVGAESAIKAANETIKADGKGYCYSLV